MVNAYFKRLTLDNFYFFFFLFLTLINDRTIFLFKIERKTQRDIVSKLSLRYETRVFFMIRKIVKNLFCTHIE